MNSNLTIKINKIIIEEAKEFAKNNQVNLSSLVENHLKSLIQKEKKIL